MQRVTLTVGSLFAGIGGFDLGLERAGMRTAWFCESEPYCQRVLAKHWPEVPCYPDITELRGAEVESVDVLCGGFPCQDLSWAGRGEGLGGARSGLWSEYARLVGELRPRYVVVENVSALLARGLGVVLGDLAALGYDAEWDCLPASAFGAPHRRDRIWIVAYPGGDDGGSRWPRGSTPGSTGQSESVGPLQVSYPDGKGLEGHGGSVRGSGERSFASGGSANGTGAASDPDIIRWIGRTGPVGQADGRGQSSDGGWWATEPDIRRVADGVPARVDRLRALGNALVPQIAEWIGRQIVGYEAATKASVAL